jgi:hypothetical protein
MKTAPRTLGRYFTHRGLTSIRGLVLDFKLHIYRGFRALNFGISGAMHFGAILLKAFVLGTFMKFRCLFGGDFKVHF